jgi:NADPH:quinone reductase-like Zn-dependent oxidoreductase
MKTRSSDGGAARLIRVYATSVNPFDCAVRAGYTNGFFNIICLILGVDVSGVVEAVGPGVTNASPGDVVYTWRASSRWRECRVCSGLCGGPCGQTTVTRSRSRRGPATCYPTAWQALVEMAQLECRVTVSSTEQRAESVTSPCSFAHWRGASDGTAD